MALLSLQQIWDAHQGRLIDKWQSYLPIYERYFERFRNTAVRVLEIGVSHGGSLQLWRAYFGHQAAITGLDIDERCIDYSNDPGVRIECGDQGNAAFMARFAKECGPWDIIIDDGSHKTSDQQISLKSLWGYLEAGGVYLIEDCHHKYPELPNEIAPALVEAYPWVIVIQKPKRIVTGEWSRALNTHEIEAYGKINAKYLHTGV